MKLTNIENMIKIKLCNKLGLREKTIKRRIKEELKSIIELIELNFKIKYIHEELLLELPSVKNLTTQDDLFWSFDSFGNSYTILIDTLEEECIDTYVRQLKMSINEIIKEEVEVLVKDKLDELQEKAYREELDTIDNIKKIVDYVFRKEIT